MAKLFANSGDPDQTPRSAASDLGLHCLPITLLRVSQLQWVKVGGFISTVKLNLLFVLRFYGPVNPMRSCRAWSVYLTTRLLGRLSPLSG